MRVLLDECLPRPFARELRGHDVQTVTSAGWSGLKNGALLAAAAGSYDVVVTVDQRFAENQALPPTFAIITLAAPSDRIEALRPLAPVLVSAIQPPGSKWLAHEVSGARKSGRYAVAKLHQMLCTATPRSRTVRRSTPGETGSTA
jgi:hypothetical protein